MRRRVGHLSVAVPASKQKEAILAVLYDEGYIASYTKEEDLNDKPQIRVTLKYDKIGEPVIREIQRMSKPGLRKYVGGGDIPMCRGGLGTMVVSTSKGMMCDREARKEGIGGELICSVF